VGGERKEEEELPLEHTEDREPQVSERSTLLTPALLPRPPSSTLLIFHDNHPRTKEC
jgi:hypothetical protein